MNQEPLGYSTALADAQPIRVLLVEDSEAARELIIDIFEHTSVGNFQLVAASRLSQAKTCLLQQGFDLVILDLGLPDSDGLGSLAAIIDTNDSLPILVLTGNDNRDLGREAINLGAQDFIVKGFGAESLLPRISYYTIERHKAHQQAVRSELFLRASIDSLPACIAIVNGQGKTLLLNQAWRELNRPHGPAEVTIKEGSDYFLTCLPLICDDQRLGELLFLRVQDILGGKIDTFETEYRHRSGSGERWYHIRVSPLRTEKHDAVIISHEDVTGRKGTEEDLFRSREYLRLIFDTSPNVVFVKDEKGRYIMANRAMSEIFGLLPSEIVGKTDGEICRAMALPEHESQRLIDQDRIVLAANRQLVIEQEPLTDYRGDTHWFRTIKLPIHFPQCPPYVLGISTEITGQRDSEDKLKNSERLLRTILDAVQYQILLLDDQLNVIWANRAAAEMSSAKLSELIGRNCKDVCRQDKHCPTCPAEQSLATGLPHNTQITQNNGATILEISTIPITNSQGKVTQVVYLAEDISQRLSYEQQLRQAQKMESLGVLAGGIAHDFNNILTAILGFTELALHKTGDNRNLHNDLNEVYKASIRARDLVQQILTFSRRIDKQLQPLDISLVVKEAMKLLRSTLPTSIEMEVQLEKNLGLVLADPTQIHQIVMNLCTNAAHAMQKSGGRLTVALRSRVFGAAAALQHQELKPGKYLEMMIADTGHGIGADILPLIFDPYFTTKGLGEGTGLGLSVVHGIVKEYGGAIKVDSVIGRGTTFTLLFPETQRQQMAAAEPTPMVNKQRGQGYTVLVVDDEPSIVKLCRRMLESNGFRVIAETDPRAALTHIESDSHSIDLVLSDLTMPHLTGDKLAARIHELAPMLPVILMSGNKANPGDFTEPTGLVRFIDKPIDNKKGSSGSCVL